MYLDLIPKMQSQFDGLAQQHPDEPKVEFWFAHARLFTPLEELSDRHSSHN